MDEDVRRRWMARLAEFHHDPLGYARLAFPWGEGVLRHVSGPRAWQQEVMAVIGTHLGNSETRLNYASGCQRRGR